MAFCTACGKSLGSPIFRTREPRCYVFQGDPGDPRNGILLHTREGVRLAVYESSLVIPAVGLEEWREQGWKSPQQEDNKN